MTRPLIALALLADYDAMPDLDFVAAAIRESLEELVEAARAAAPRKTAAV